MNHVGSRRSTLALAALAAALALGTAHAQHRDEHFGRERGRDGHEHFDARFHHDRAYPARGVVVDVLPREHFEVVRGPAHYFFSGGVWYAARGPRFIVVAPPFGVFVPVLPPVYTTIWVGGMPYYYADDAYYVYRGADRGYEVVPPPADDMVSTQPPADAPPGAAQPAPPGAPRSSDVYIYPKNGQSAEQQSNDRYECHRWASSQTGFDPTQPGGGVPPTESASKRADYNRALGACLEGRGYTVR